MQLSQYTDNKMIKLKDILSESTNIDLHKIITAKDNPSFMTEEEWAGKWNSIKETSGIDSKLGNFKSRKGQDKTSNIDAAILGELAKSTIIDESLLEGPDHDWFKNRVYQGVMRKAIIKFVMSLTPNSRSTKILQKYFETGKITNRDTSQVLREWGKWIKATATGVTAVLFGLLYRVGIFKGAHVLALPVIQTIIHFALRLGVTSILPNNIGGEKYYVKRLNKATSYLTKRKEDSDKEKKSIDNINKRIKQVKGKPGLFK